MLSRRKRDAARQDETAEQLLEAYHACRPVPRAGTHTLLRWLVMTRCYHLLDDVPPCPLAAANAVPAIIAQDQLEQMEQEVASRVHACEQPEPYLMYAAYFFRWWSAVTCVTSTALMTQRAGELCTWLSERDIERSLVVPDVRRAAIKLAQQMELRAGEREYVSGLMGGVKSITAVAQAMRTAERCDLLHTTLMYGTLTDIYHRDMLGAVYFAIINGRYLGRINFDFIAKVLVLPCHTSLPSDVGWPLIYIHGDHYIVYHKQTHAAFPSARAAYSQWVACCLAQGGVIGGCYDVRKCTI